MSDSGRIPGSFYALSAELLSAAFPEAAGEWVEEQATSITGQVPAARIVRQPRRSVPQAPDRSVRDVVDYRWQDMSGGDFRKAQLRRALLVGTDFRGADLERADLHFADLRWADLGEADLRRADLGESDLDCADLRGADLSEADLRGANLGSVDFYGANLSGTQLPDGIIVCAEDTLDALVVAATKGIAPAIDELLSIILPLVTRYLRARLGHSRENYPSAEDIAQEVCMSVLAALPGYQDQGRPFLAFVYGIAAHKVADAHRATAREQAVRSIGSFDLERLEDRLDSLNGRIRDLLGALPKAQREVLVLRIVDGFSAEEVAFATGTTPAAVRVAQHRALSKLRRVLAADADLREVR